MRKREDDGRWTGESQLFIIGLEIVLIDVIVFNKWTYILRKCGSFGICFHEIVFYYLQVGRLKPFSCIYKLNVYRMQVDRNKLNSQNRKICCIIF